MSNTEVPLDPVTANGRIRRVEQVVQSGRRFRSRTFLLVGVVCLAYFALMGGISDRGFGLPSIVLTLVPVLAVVVLADIWGKHRGLESRQLLALEYRLAGVFAVTVCVAAVLATVLPHPMPAALAGILPAAVCLIGARRVVGR